MPRYRLTVSDRDPDAARSAIRGRRPVACALLAFVLAGCGFESRVEGQWNPAPGTLTNKELSRHGVPASLREGFEANTFVVADNVVYLGRESSQTAIARYTIGRVDGDCAPVEIETASAGEGAPAEKTSVQACLDGDQMTLRHNVRGEALRVTLRRAK